VPTGAGAHVSCLEEGRREADPAEEDAEESQIPLAVGFLQVRVRTHSARSSAGTAWSIRSRWRASRSTPAADGTNWSATPPRNIQEASVRRM